MQILIIVISILISFYSIVAGILLLVFISFLERGVLGDSDKLTPKEKDKIKAINVIAWFMIVVPLILWFTLGVFMF